MREIVLNEIPRSMVFTRPRPRAATRDKHYCSEVGATNHRRCRLFQREESEMTNGNMRKAVGLQITKKNLWSSSNSHEFRDADLPISASM